MGYTYDTTTGVYNILVDSTKQIINSVLSANTALTPP